MSDKPETPVTSAPAIHGDTLWDLDKLPDGMIHNLGPTPQRITTKTEYKAILNAQGKHMKDQQESVLGPELAPVAEPEPEPLPVAPEFTEGTARSFAAFSRILSRYGLREHVWCQVCFAIGQNAGCRVTRSGDNHSIAVKCNCALRRHTSVMELGYTPSNALTLGNETTGSVLTADGQVNVPTTILESDDAKLVLRYYATLRAMKLNNTLVCAKCDSACEQNVTEDEINIVCDCRIRYWSGTRH